MCMGCWAEGGSPSIVNERTVEAARLISVIYEYNAVGSNLHITTDDWNVEDENIEFCRNCINSDPELTDDQKRVELRVCEILAAMTEGERLSALALHSGYLDMPPTTKVRV